ncbi:MarR family winged helix-turn-helix transcriptional regulator [Planosporangium sp. 12N6]|uniref:MarR family winged helix-turn-helix transcriptional regulator n=1 Tax=Planosporangium spinosum TaxID=3402278 RepID=UPI003CE8286E
MTAVPDAGLDERLRALVRALRVARQRLLVQDVPVQPGMIGILSAIGSAGEDAGCHPKELAVRCALDASTISRAVATLVARGLVRRSADPADGRACILTLTPAGRTVLADLQGRQAEYLTTALRDWTGPELDAFAAALTRFADDLTTYLDRTAAADMATAHVSGPSHDHPSEPETPTLEAAL